MPLGIRTILRNSLAKFWLIASVVGLTMAKPIMTLVTNKVIAKRKRAMRLKRRAFFNLKIFYHPTTGLGQVITFDLWPIL